MSCRPLVFIYKNIWRFTKWLVPMGKEFLQEDLWPLLKSFLRVSWRFLSRFYHLVKGKSPALEKALHFVASALAQAVFYVFKGLYFIIFYLLKIVWYATVVFM
jgi:hypothetical protein